MDDLTDLRCDTAWASLELFELILDERLEGVRVISTSADTPDTEDFPLVVLRGESVPPTSKSDNSALADNLLDCLTGLGDNASAGTTPVAILLNTTEGKALEVEATSLSLSFVVEEEAAMDFLLIAGWTNSLPSTSS